MSEKHPIVVITGSSGAGTTTVKTAFNRIFRREGLTAAVVEGDSFHRYDRKAMKELMAKALKKHRNFSHFGPEANDFRTLQELFQTYAETGTGRHRYYIHNEEEAEMHGSAPGTFTDWEELPRPTDMLFYEGLHGCVQTEDVDLARLADLKVGVAPIINLEWIQKIHRDGSERGHLPEDVTDAILRRMYDYVHYITPQFSITDINFQRVPLVDTSNPFIARDIPTLDQSQIVIRIADPRNWDVDFDHYLSRIEGSFMSARNMIVVPGGKMEMAMEIVMMDMLSTIGIIKNHVRK
jgi:phosphoribulokinase